MRFLGRGQGLAAYSGDLTFGLEWTKRDLTFRFFPSRQWFDLR